MRGWVPMMVVRDFNFSENDEDKVKDNGHEPSNLELKNYALEQTTLSSSCIDLPFSKFSKISLYWKLFSDSNEHLSQNSNTILLKNDVRSSKRRH